MTRDLPDNLVRLTRQYARDLGQIAPSASLDARIDRLVADAPRVSRPRPARRAHHPLAWAALACLAVVTVSAGVVIGMRLERARDVAAVNGLARDAAQQVAWSPGDLSMWPADSVALTIPAEYSPQGTLVAVNPRVPGSKSSGKRYWIDVIVSNDGTVRIERIVPADTATPQQQADEDGVRPFIQ